MTGGFAAGISCVSSVSSALLRDLHRGFSSFRQIQATESRPWCDGQQVPLMIPAAFGVFDGSTCIDRAACARGLTSRGHAQTWQKSVIAMMLCRRYDLGMKKHPPTNRSP